MIRIAESDDRTSPASAAGAGLVAGAGLGALAGNALVSRNYRGVQTALQNAADSATNRLARLESRMGANGSAYGKLSKLEGEKLKEAQDKIRAAYEKKFFRLNREIGAAESAKALNESRLGRMKTIGRMGGGALGAGLGAYGLYRAFRKSRPDEQGGLHD